MEQLQPPEAAEGESPEEDAGAEAVFEGSAWRDHVKPDVVVLVLTVDDEHVVLVDDIENHHVGLRRILYVLPRPSASL